MNFECLSTEIIFEIFDFLHNIHILHSFSHLNNLFTDLLITYFRVSPRLDFRSMTKSHFNIACKSFIPLIAENIHSLRLSNDDDTPQQIALFLSHGLSLCKFPHLKSLSLHHMHSEVTINRMMIEWHYPIHLTHLNIPNCRILNDWNIVYSLINNIWRLPNLTHCQLDIHVIDEVYSIFPTVISSTLESLSIKNIDCNFGELISLFEHTPRLRYLDITVNETSSNHSDLSFSVPLLTTLKLIYSGPFSALRKLLENVPNLRHWTMRTENVVVTGKDWEEIISNHLPKLKTFHLRMQIYPQSWETSLFTLIETYTFKFWVEKHQWPIRAHSYLSPNAGETILLYTLPYTFDDYDILLSDRYKQLGSYLSNHDNQMFYERVHYLSYTSSTPIIEPLRNQFSHIYHLLLKLPFNKKVWTLFPTFNHLRILDISCSYTEKYDKNALLQLQSLLDQAPKLYSLIFQSSIDLELTLLECISKSIVKIDLQTSDKYFDCSNCFTLFLSTLGKQCQILSIKVNDRMTILQLVKEMPQLCTLNVDLPSDEHKTDDLIEWLRRQLPSTCIITRDSTRSHKIQIWIR